MVIYREDPGGQRPALAMVGTEERHLPNMALTGDIEECYSAL